MNELLILAGIVAGVIAVAILIVYLVKRFGISKEDLETGFDIMQIVYALTEAIVKETGKIEDEELEDFSRIIYSTVEYIKNVSMNSGEELDEGMLIAEGIEFAGELYVSFGYELTENRKAIIVQAMNLTLVTYGKLIK